METENPLGPSGAALVATGLDGSVKLESLTMRKCGIKDHGMTSLARVLDNCTALAAINLQHNELGPASGVACNARIQNVGISQACMVCRRCPWRAAVPLDRPEASGPELEPVACGGGERAVRAARERIRRADAAAGVDGCVYN